MAETQKIDGKNTKEMKKFKFPNAYTLIFMIIIACTVLTYIVPAGTFDRVVDINTGRTIVDPATFQYVENAPVGLHEMLMAIPKGMKAAGSIIFFVFIVAGSFEILNTSGFTEASIGVLLKRYHGKEHILFPLIILALATCAATFGMAEEAIVFIPILLALSKAMGYDAMVAAAITYGGVRAGHINGMINPFNVGIAHGLAELPLYSGLWYRSIWFFVTIAFTSFIILRYCKKIKADPTKSIMYGITNEAPHEADISSLPDFEKKHKIMFLVVIATFGFLMYGVYQYGWYLNEIAALFIGFGIVIGIVNRNNGSEIADSFLSGAKGIVFGALIIGVARGILVVLESGLILDTIIMSSADLLKGMPSIVAANGMYVFQWVLNIIIPSGSGQAATTMPIMIPIADLLNINRQVAVTAFHYGDGVTNLITPASGPLMACLALAGIPFEKWAKWVLPLLAGWTIIGFLSVSIAHLINLGPF